jgi:hypothetical protein
MPGARAAAARVGNGGAAQAPPPPAARVVNGGAAQAQPAFRAPVMRPGPFPPFPIPRPVTYVDGTLLKTNSNPEVDIISGRERRWIPDPQTFNYMGLDWGAINIISDADWAAIPAGPPLPSRSDGTLLKGSTDPVYVMQNGQRHWIPDPTTFNLMGYSWSAIQVVADNDLNAIPLGAEVPPEAIRPSFPITASRDDNFPGSGGFMHTDVTVYADGTLNAVTHTWEVTDLRGFRGAVAVTLLDQNQANPWVTPTQHFGVDGRWIGTSDRTDNWSVGVPPDVLANARYIAIVQQWDPNVVADIEAWIQGLSNVAQQLASLIKAIGTIVSVL